MSVYIPPTSSAGQSKIEGTHHWANEDLSPEQVNRIAKSLQQLGQGRATPSIKELNNKILFRINQLQLLDKVSGKADQDANLKEALEALIDTLAPYTEDAGITSVISAIVELLNSYDQSQSNFSITQLGNLKKRLVGFFLKSMYRHIPAEILEELKELDLLLQERLEQKNAGLNGPNLKVLIEQYDTVKLVCETLERHIQVLRAGRLPKDLLNRLETNATAVIESVLAHISKKLSEVDFQKQVRSLSTAFEHSLFDLEKSISTQELHILNALEGLRKVQAYFALFAQS